MPRMRPAVLDTAGVPASHTRILCRVSEGVAAAPVRSTPEASCPSFGWKSLTGLLNVIEAMARRPMSILGTKMVGFSTNCARTRTWSLKVLSRMGSSTCFLEGRVPFSKVLGSLKSGSGRSVAKESRQIVRTFHWRKLAKVCLH